MSYFHPFEVVGRGSETQLQVGGSLDYSIYQFIWSGRDVDLLLTSSSVFPGIHSLSVVMLDIFYEKVEVDTCYPHSQVSYVTVTKTKLQIQQYLNGGVYFTPGISLQVVER